LGEGWHNNHHRYQSSVRQGIYWWEIYITYYLLRFLAWTGLIWELKGVPRSVYEEADRGGRGKSGAPASPDLAGELPRKSPGIRGDQKAVQV
jgi:stearoyl-CoA desaturase (delta-9 desaturase)